MELFKGFAHQGHLVDNVMHVVNPIGELSSMGSTYSKDKSLYTNANYNGLTLVGFEYKLDDTPIVMSLANQNLLFEIMDWIYAQSRAGAFTAERAEFQTKFLVKFGARADYKNSGKMVRYQNDKYCPEFIDIAPSGASAVISWKIWFADEAFRNQCDAFEIVVIPPVEDLDTLFDTFIAVKDLISPPDIQDLNNKANIAKGDYPYTALRTWDFEWIDRGNSANKLTMYWLTVHYGEAGNNLDSVKEAIRTYILANSIHSREEWAKIAPDIFTSSEFIIIPAIQNVAVPNRTRSSGLYSPTISPTVANEMAVLFSKGTAYTEAHILEHIEITSSLFRSAALVVVGGPENLYGIKKFSQRYPDYANLQTTHVDFGYMQEGTRQFVMLVTQLLALADSTTPSTSIPRGFNRITRDGIVYVSATLDRFLYLVATKYSIQELLP